MLKLFLVGGARPNFMKIAPLYRELKKNSDKIETKIIHTGQHYDYAMSKVFFEQLGLPQPDYYLNVGSSSHAVQTANIMVAVEKVFEQDKPDWLFVVGDVNSTIACSLTAVKLGIKVAHVEAGLRSFDMDMPEEINRILTDRISNLLLCSEPSGIKNLRAEGYDMSKVHLVGNTMIDTLAYHLESIKQNDYYKTLDLKASNYICLTLHRPSNVDNHNNLLNLFNILEYAAKQSYIIFSAHPRTVKNIANFGLKEKFDSIANLKIIDPVGYFEFMNLVVNSKFILTDSGGIQEETTYLGIPCITLRENTERPLTSDGGTNKVVGTNFDKVATAIKWAAEFNRSEYKAPALWDGKAAERIVEIIVNY